MEYIGNIELDDKLENKELIIYGIGKYGEAIYKFLKNNGLQSNVLCFCVSDTENVSIKEFDNKKIKKVSEVVAELPKADYLIGGKYACEMIEELRKKGINKIHVLFF